MSYYPQEEEKKESSDAGDKDIFLSEEVLIDRESKLRMVLQSVEDNLSADSEHEDIRYIYQALHAGDSLRGKVLSGGYTNYSYQLYLENDRKTKLFAKACFSYALWCPGEKKHYDLDRQTCEFNLMKQFSETMGSDNDNEESPVVKPYLLLDISDEVRVLVSQWASADEQWANQFIEGEVDRRVLPKVATAMTKVSLTELEDKDFNQGMLTGLREMMGTFEATNDKLFDQTQNPNSDACIKYLHYIGRNRFQLLQDAMHAIESRKDCLVHADSHLFNILVEAKPDIEKLHQFGEKGNFVLCDWEMAHVSCHGLDLGVLFYIPIACAYFHAAGGFLDKAQEIIGHLDEIWETYATHMVQEGGKDEDFLKDAFLNVAGFCGGRMFSVLYASKAQVEYLHNGDLTQEEIDTVLATVGLTGVQLEEVAFGCDREDVDISLEDLREWFRSLLQEKASSLATEMASRRTSAIRRRSRRTSSLLRVTGRRVSDASLQFDLELASDRSFRC
jgi:hypothetical protein